MNMNKKELEAFAREAAKGIKTPEDLNEFSQMLKKITVEAALNAEMDEHLGYEKHHKSTSTNSRNGKSTKRVKTEDGEFEYLLYEDQVNYFWGTYQRSEIDMLISNMKVLSNDGKL